MKKVTILWLAVAGLTTLFCGLVYATVQQSIRQSANDPQIEISEDAGRALENGIPPASIIGTNKTDLTKSLGAFVIIYDETGKIIASSATLEGSALVPPQGVFEYAKNHLDNRLTWEPVKGVREAIVVKHFAGNNPGFILVGRSLREVEVRENGIMKIAFAAWVAGLIFIFVCSLAYAILGNRGYLR